MASQQLHGLRGDAPDYGERNAHPEATALATQLREKISAKTLKIGIIGLGYVGLPLAVEFGQRGIQVLGFDVDAAKTQAINRGDNYIQDVDSDVLRRLVRDKLLDATEDFSQIAGCDVLYICVPTPFTPNKEPDIQYIMSATGNIAAHMQLGQLVILKSTTFPNTTEGHVLPQLENEQRKVGRNFFLAFSPERIDPGNQRFNTGNTPVVVGGVTPLCTKLAAEVNELIIAEVVSVSNPKVAEMSKLLENIFRSVNIALVNELAQLCDRMGGINVWEAIEAASTKPFGFMPFFPGPGIGGHCILIDPYYLSWAARKDDFVTNFITLAAEVNESMPFYVRDMITREIARQPVTTIEARILLLGVAFKRDVDDLRHSPALKVIELLDEDDIPNINYFDPYVPSIRIHGRTIDSLPAIDPEVLKSYDVCVITTDHSSFDYDMIAANSNVVIDTRNACRNVPEADRAKVVLLGDGK